MRTRANSVFDLELLAAPPRKSPANPAISATLDNSLLTICSKEHAAKYKSRRELPISCYANVSHRSLRGEHQFPLVK
jgi:hypothetical protein